MQPVDAPICTTPEAPRALTPCDAQGSNDPDGLIPAAAAAHHESQDMTPQDAKRVLETALMCAQAPLSMREMLLLFDEQIDADALHAALNELASDWQGRGCELVALAGPTRAAAW